MDTIAIITIIGGIALLVALVGGGIKAKEIEIPKIPSSLRFLSGIMGILLIGMALRLSYPNLVTLPAVTSTISPITTQSVEPTPQPTALSAASTTQPASPTSQAITQPLASDLYFNEDFEDGIADDFRFSAEDWRVIDVGTDNFVLEANSLDNSLAEWTQADFGPVTLGDYSIEYRIKFIEYDFSKETISGWTSLVFRQGSSGSYGFVLNPYQHRIELNYITSNGGSDLIHAEDGFRSFDFQKNVWYSIRIDVHGTQIKVFVDEKLMFSFEDSRVKEGGLAFQRAPYSIVQFDDVRVMK